MQKQKIQKKIAVSFLSLILIIPFTGCPQQNNPPDNSDIPENQNNSENQENPPKQEIDLSSTGIPTVYLSIDNGEKLKDTETWCNAKLKIINADGTTDYNETSILAKGRGNSSWKWDKQSFSLKLTEKSKMLGMKKHKRWVLIGNHVDKSLLRNYYASVLGNKIFNKEWNPSFQSVNLYYNGNYWGTYLFGEQIKIDSKRVDIQDISDFEDASKKLEMKDLNNDGKITLADGGFIVEVNTLQDEAFNFKTTKCGLPMSLKDPDEVGKETQELVKNTIQTVEDAIYSETFKDPETGYAKYIDIDSFIDWYFVNDFSKNPDAACTASIYMYYNPSDKKLHFGPNWDFDLAFGNINYANCESTEGEHIYIEKNGNGSSSSSGNQGWPWGWGWGANMGMLSQTGGHPWFNRLMNDESFKARVKARWEEKKSELYTSITTDIQKYADELSASSVYNFQKWQVLGTNFSINGLPNCSESGYKNRKTYQAQVDYLIDWCTKRWTWLDSYYSAW